MLVLALDTATPGVTAGVVELTGDSAPRLIARRVTVNARAHGELLTPHIQDALTEAGLRLADLDAVVCGCGPGPFTGLRVGLATAAALSHALDRPAYPVCTLDAVALDCADQNGNFVVATDARRREVYWAVYDPRGMALTQPEVSRPADIGDQLNKFGVGAAAGEGARMYADIFRLPLIDARYPSPTSLVAAAKSALLAGDTPQPLTPLYLRRADAVELAPRKREVAT